ncbi:MAG: glutamate-5-semialdehyde dehydrogenase [Oscillospiraceae bacterium]|nr:glutamate-5-semialdehyde dehydrogenase [Oscillospiraceae bacterium]
MLETLGKRAKEASRILAETPEQDKNRALNAMADALLFCAPQILEANALDCEKAEKDGMSRAFLDRLRLSDARISSMADALREVAALPDPVGRILEDKTRPNGLHIVKIAVPLGVIGVIFEARPNVTADSAALCLKSGNAVILRGGSDAIRSNTAVCKALRMALKDSGLPEDCVQLVEDTSRESATALMRLSDYLDVIIPRGGAGLIRAVVQNATVPVIETGTGVCHIYVDREADIEMAAKIIHNAKTSRPSVCNAAECILVHSAIAEKALPVIAKALESPKVEIRGDARACQILPSIVPAQDDDWGREYGDLILACRVVDSMDEALAHIRAYGTGHSEAIITENADTAAVFLESVDAAAVYHNASTRFTDGGEFGLGAEIGISTQKLHVRGPVGLRELCSMKYKIYGEGQIR